MKHYSHLFLTALTLLLSGCGHNVYWEREITGIRLDIPVGDGTVGFAVGCDKSVKATVRGGASFETSSSNGGGLFSGSGGQSKITQFKSHAQLNEGNLVKVFCSSNVPDAAKIMLASNLASSVNAPYFPGSILQTKESTIHIGRAAIQSNNVEQIQSTDHQGINLLVDRTAKVVGTNIVNHTLDTAKDIVGTNIVNHTLDTTKDIVGTNVVNHTLDTTKEIVGTNIVPTTVSSVTETVHDALNPLEGTVSEIRGTVAQVDTVVKDVNETVKDVRDSVVRLILVIVGGLLLILVMMCIFRNKKKSTSYHKIVVDANPDSILDEATDEDLKKHEITVTKEQIRGQKLGFWRSLAKYSMTAILTVARWIKLIPPDTRKKIIDFLVDQWKSRQAQKAAEKKVANEKKK